MEHEIWRNKKKHKKYTTVKSKWSIMKYKISKAYYKYGIIFDCNTFYYIVLYTSSYSVLIRKINYFCPILNGEMCHIAKFPHIFYLLDQ